MLIKYRKLYMRYSRRNIYQIILSMMLLWSSTVAKLSTKHRDPKSYSLFATSGWGATTKICPIAFHEIGNRCYFYGYFNLNWFRAAEFCHSFGEAVSLAVVETEEENIHLKNWLTIHADHTTGVWVGGSENGHAGKWAWFPTGQLIEYKNWGPSQPSGGDQHCMYLVGGLLGYQWADFHCEFEMKFLCEYRVNSDRPW